MAAFIIIVIVVMVVAAFIVIIIVVMMVAASVMVMMMVFFFQLHDFFHHLALKIACTLDRIKDFFSIKFIERCCDYRSFFIIFSDLFDTFPDLFFIHLVSSCKHDRSCMLNLIDVELAKVLYIHFALAAVNHRNSTSKLDILTFHCILYSFHDI